MNPKPSYLGLLNSIANGESAAEVYLEAWVCTTKRDDVRQVISTVAAREGEHGKSFAKRINELGFSVQPRSDGRAADRMAIATSTTLSDREKFEKLDLGRAVQPGKTDNFATFLDDVSIDIATGTLLGRYISEERDSGRLLRCCYAALCKEEEVACPATPNGSATSLGDVEDRLCRIETLLGKLVDAERSELSELSVR